jgi:beta-mannosidase
MSRRILDLSPLPWRFGRVERQPFGAQPVDDRASVTEWLPARVPGDVRADLIAAGRIPPVETPEGIAAGVWVDDYDWWYRVDLPGGLAADEVTILEADGIDYYSAIWLDGQRLAAHAGMFSRQSLVLSPTLNAPGAHELAIRVWGQGALPKAPNPPWRRAFRWLLGRVSPGTEYFPDRMATPKAQFSFGWDFAPRLLSAGIWDEIRLIVTRGVYIEDLWVQAEPMLGRGGAEAWRSGGAWETAPARLDARLRVSRWQAGALRAEITVAPEGFSAPLKRTTFDLDLNLSLSLNLTLDLPSARLWWPWDQGEPNLYRVTVRLLDDAGVVDEAAQVVGVRSVARAAFSDGGKWRWLINGRAVFLRGANWVPADVLPGRVTEVDYARLLGTARDAGINFLRVWGGGVREKRAFWDICDRLGIVVWQEFPLACAFLDHYPRDPAYLDALAAEARGAVRALRNHPSLIAWCGGNEISPRRERLPLETIAGVLAEEDPVRPWIPSSPCDDDRHHWQVWHGLAPWTDLAELDTPFMSEFGLQALPDAATVAEMFPTGAPTSLTDPRWAERKAQIEKLHHYAGLDAGPSTGSGPGPSTGSGLGLADSQPALVAAIAATQRAQATALQVGIESCRLRRETLTGRAELREDAIATEASGASSPTPTPCSPCLRGELQRCGGVAFWQLNEPWPAVSWSVIDHAGRPKAAYEMLRRAYQPILIAARFPWRRYTAADIFRAEVWLVNDGPTAWQGCRAEALLDGTVVWMAADVTMLPASAAPIGDLVVRLDAAPHDLTLSLRCGEMILAANRYDLAVHLPSRQPWRARQIHALGERLLEMD